MGRKVVFIMSSVQDTHALKRIGEFLDHGYMVKVYGFNRSNISIPTENRFPIEIVGNFASERNYFSRLPVMFRAMKYIAGKHSRSDLFYYFGLDIAIIARMSLHNKYIYEECDLLNAYFKQKFISLPLKWYDRRIIKQSVETVLTSDGFRVYHFGDNVPRNVTVIPNKLNPWCLEAYNTAPLHKTVSDTLRIGFVGMIRAKAVYNFAHVFAREFPAYEFHFFGVVSSWTKQQIELLEQYPNVKFHGQFMNPGDLPNIYAEIDLVLATYDTECENPRFAEPNKLYEAIFYETPIIVSQNTFLADRVLSLNVGFSVDAMDDKSVISLVSSLTGDVIKEKKEACKAISKPDSINDNRQFFQKLKSQIG